MKTHIRNFLISGLCISSILGLNSCSQNSNKSQYIEGRVIEEYGNIPSLTHSSGALFGNESVKYSQKVYGIKVEAGIEIYNIQIDPNEWNFTFLAKDHSMANLEASIEKETQVKFPVKNYYGDDMFPKDKIGCLNPNDIEVLGKD